MLWRGGGGYKRRQRGRQKTKRARRSVLFCGGLGRFSRGVHMIDTAALTIKYRPPEGLIGIFGGGWWIRTTEGIASRFTVCPLWPLGKSPKYTGIQLELVDGFEPPTC